ncbi:phytohormone-binding protein-like [Heracleum sosnowskyi]|uniref:Phytohormone-binding protein-like n=1 Tax=Heracleum sosnowskyi TaxID=360622 RepID=A0AAD8MN34_9APIA|nr:phytohormone-binding protein-like [Heracleum sosnowskyi]
MVVLALFSYLSLPLKIADQKEKIVELDESLHLIALQVMEGGHLNHGFTSYKTSFQLTAFTDSETLVDMKVVYETEAEETLMPQETTNSALAFLKCVETYVLKEGS